MTEIKAQLNYHRISPRKVRAVAGLISGKKVREALTQLNLVNKRSALPLTKLLKSAVNNAKNNFNIADENKLIVKTIAVNSGMTLKRYMPRARGVSNMIKKRTSHIEIILTEQLQNKKLNQSASRQDLKNKRHE